jgi:hypothetical protein
MFYPDVVGCLFWVVSALFCRGHSLICYSAFCCFDVLISSWSGIATVLGDCCGITYLYSMPSPASVLLGAFPCEHFSAVPDLLQVSTGCLYVVCLLVYLCC